MEKGKTSNGSDKKFLGLAKQYREIANEAKHSIGIHKAVLNRLQSEYATLKESEELTESDLEKKSGLESQISSANKVLAGLSSKFKSADALARRYESMCELQSPEEESFEDILPIEETPEATEMEESFSPVQDAPAAAVAAAESVPEKKSRFHKFSLWFVIIPLLIVALVAVGVMLSKRTSKDEPKASDPYVSTPVQTSVEAKVEAPSISVTQQPSQEELAQETIEVSNVSEEYQSEVFEQNMSADSDVALEPEVVEETTEQKVVMFLGFSDSEAEQWYTDHDYEVIVLDYVPAASPVQEKAPVEEKTVEAVSAEEVLEEAAEEEIEIITEVIVEEATAEIEEAVEEVVAEEISEEVEVEEVLDVEQTYEHVFSYYIYSAKIVAADGYAYATYPSFVTSDEIYAAANAAVYTYGDAVRDFYISVVEPGRFEVSYPMGFAESDYRFAFEILDRDLPIYIASLFATSEETVLEATIEESPEEIVIVLPAENEEENLEVVEEEEIPFAEEPVEELVEDPVEEIDEEPVVEQVAAEASLDEMSTDSETVVIESTEKATAESKYTFSDLRINAGLIPYSFQRIHFKSIYTDETSLSGIGFKFGVFKFFKNNIALGVEFSDVSYQYRVRSFNDQRILLKLRSYLPLNAYSDSNLFLTLGAGIDIVTRNDGNVGFYGLANVDFGASFQVSEDLYFESGAEFMVGFKEDRTTFSVGANFGLTYHIQSSDRAAR